MKDKKASSMVAFSWFFNYFLNNNQHVELEGRDTSLALLSMVPRLQRGGAVCGLLGSSLLQSDGWPALSETEGLGKYYRGRTKYLYYFFLLLAGRAGGGSLSKL